MELATVIPETRIDLSLPQYASLTQPGGWLVVGQLLLINHPQLGWLALDRWCTHASGSLTFVPGPDRLVCPVHFSEFNLDGSVHQGPAQRPVRRYLVQKEGNVLVIKG
jgi:Rieske Fe-S protein